MKDMGELHHFLGVKIVQKPDLKEIWIGQEAYTKGVLQKFGMESSKPMSTPAECETKLVKPTEDRERVDQVRYQSAVGNLLYLSTKTRPDIAHAVNKIARFIAEPTK